jgi:hypothetical protein
MGRAPVFFSPNIDRLHHCGLCTATFTPLVYQTGYTTQSQHDHETVGGMRRVPSRSTTARSISPVAAEPRCRHE